MKPRGAALLLAALAAAAAPWRASAVLHVRAGGQASPVVRSLAISSREQGGFAADKALPEGCGALPQYANAKPKDYKDARATFYNATSKKTEPVVFKSGDKVVFQCDAGHTTDASKDGNKTFEVECLPQGYYKPSGVCLQASKCGPVPNISHAAPTGKLVNGRVEFACSQGYSLDGQKVTAGGMGRNRFFELKCIEFSGSYEEFKGNCTPYAFMPSTATTRLYNQLFAVLFVHSCKGSLQNAFGKGKAPSGLDSVCAGFGDSSSACQGLVSKIKSDFESELQARQAFEKENPKDWYEKSNLVAPDIDDEAQTFCSELWKLLELPSL